MRLTRFTDYGLRILMLLAAAPGQSLSTAVLSAELGLSRHHLAKIVQRLAEGGIVATRRGGGGGAELRLPPETVRLGAVVRLLESGQPLVDCLAPGGDCTLMGRCRLVARLRGAERAFFDSLDAATLADIALDQPFAA